MSNISASVFASKAEQFLGRSYKEMDCRQLINNMLIAVGLTGKYSGSNALWRDMAWTGTPEEAVKKFGCVPVGALLYILDFDGGEVARGYKDGLGNASHVGVKTGTGKGAIHSSSTRQCVAESEFHDKTIPNGGWNRIGLMKQLDYGFDVSTTDQPSSGAVTNDNTSWSAYAYSSIRKGDKGSNVEYAQNLLLALGYELPKYGADGSFGDETVAAVKAFQKDEGLSITGIIDPDTWTALENETANPTPKGQTSDDTLTTGQMNTPVDQTSVPAYTVTSSATATVHSSNGKTVKMRHKPSTTCNLYWDVPNNAVVTVRGSDSNGWTPISYNGRSGYVMSSFLTVDEQDMTYDEAPSTAPNTTVETFSSYAVEFYDLTYEQAVGLQSEIQEFPSRIEGRNG